MDASHSFAPLLTVLVIAFAVPIFLSRIKFLSIPIVVGEIVAGMIVGRSGFSFVPPDDLLVGIFANFGIVFLMFLSGMVILLTSPEANTVLRRKGQRRGKTLSKNRLCAACASSIIFSLFPAW